MRVNDILRMELMAECLGKRPAFLVQERPWSPTSSTTLPQRHLELSRILAPFRRAIAIRSSSGLGHRRILVGDTGDIISDVPPLFLFRFCIWRSSKNKSDVCHVLCEVLIIMLDVTQSQPKLMLKQSLVRYYQILLVYQLQLQYNDIQHISSFWRPRKMVYCFCPTF